MAILGTEFCFAQAPVRYKVDLRVNRIDWGKYTNLRPEVLALKKFNNSGVYVDKYSQIHIAEEKNHVDLSCFNCISKSVGPNQYEHSSDNKEVFQP